MQITIEMIETKEFKTKPRGYDPQEVDEFLDAICDEMARQLDEIQALQQQLAAAKAARPMAEAPTTQVKPVQAKPVATVPDDSFREILEMAQKVKNETIAAAEAKAAAIIAKAEEDAADKLGNLAEEKEKLSGQVTTLKAAAADYRAKFEALLQAQQEAIEKAADLF